MGYKTLFGAFIVLLASSSFAFACAGGFLQALLFNAYPEAKAATIAISKASLRGALQGEKWSRGSGKSLHAWRAEKTKVTVRNLQDQLNSRRWPGEGAAKTGVFLVLEFSWLAVQRQGNRITVSRQPYGTRMSGNKIFTSRRVLDNILAGTVTWQHAVDQGLITSRCTRDCANQRHGLLGLGMITPLKKARAGLQ